MAAYLFIDAGYIEKLMRDTMSIFSGSPFDLENINYHRLKEYCGAEKAFYYNSLDEDKHDNETEEQRAQRVEATLARVNKIRLLPDFHVRPGSLQGKMGKQKKTQKEVDVQLTVDVLSHVFNKNCRMVSLLAGDLDFRPLVEAVVNLGGRMTVFSSPTNTNEQLKYAADEWKSLEFTQLLEFTIQSFKSAHPHPSTNAQGQFYPDDKQYIPLDRGIHDGKTVYLARHHMYPNHEAFFMGDPLPGNAPFHRAFVVNGMNEQVVRGFCELYHPVIWEGQPWRS